MGLRLLIVAIFRRLRGVPPGGPELLRGALQDLGGAFIKFGQVLSLQVELFPPEYCNALLALLDLIPSFSRREVERIFSEEFGAPPEQLYAQFDYTPIAAASIGQVHRAVLKDGSRVAVKVQRPGIHHIFERDCQLLESLVKLIVSLRIRGLYFLRESVRELSAWTRDELDYRREASYCEFLGRNAAPGSAEKIPKVYWDLTTSRVLTIEFLDGPSVAQYFRFVESPGTRDYGERLATIQAGGFDAA